MEGIAVNVEWASYALANIINMSTSYSYGIRINIHYCMCYCRYWMWRKVIQPVTDQLVMSTLIWEGVCMYVTQYGYIDIVCHLQSVISHSVRIRAHINYCIMIYDILITMNCWLHEQASYGITVYRHYVYVPHMCVFVIYRLWPYIPHHSMLVKS